MELTFCSQRPNVLTQTLNGMNMNRIYNRNHFYLRIAPSGCRVTSFSWASSSFTWPSYVSSLCVACDYYLLTKNTKQRKRSHAASRSVVLTTLRDALVVKRIIKNMLKLYYNGITVKEKIHNSKIEKTEHGAVTDALLWVPITNTVQRSPRVGKCDGEATLEGVCGRMQLGKLT